VGHDLPDGRRHRWRRPHRDGILRF
jgi:hypothetical protein